MKIAFFDSHSYEIAAWQKSVHYSAHEISFFEPRLTEKTASLAKDFTAVCSFVNDRLDRPTVAALAKNGVKVIVLRCAGFNHVDLQATEEFGIPVLRVPEYSPYAVAEHAVSLILSLNRKIHRAYSRVREGNFSLDGLVGFDLHGKTVGVVGTGRIGSVFAKIMLGFGCHVVAYDRQPAPELTKLGINYVELDKVFANSDILSLHIPLTPATHHLVNEARLKLCKSNLMLINTSRGALVDTKALIQALKRGKIGAAGLDVYEEEGGVFFKNLSSQILQDDQLARLLTFPNVLLTSHQGFLTEEALANIAETTFENLLAFEQGKKLLNEVRANTHTQ
jgi:D-lactate dehydrogenase